jgi:hypothetical protein
VLPDKAVVGDSANVDVDRLRFSYRVKALSHPLKRMRRIGCP